MPRSLYYADFSLAFDAFPMIAFATGENMIRFETRGKIVKLWHELHARSLASFPRSLPPSSVSSSLPEECVENVTASERRGRGRGRECDPNDDDDDCLAHAPPVRPTCYTVHTHTGLGIKVDPRLIEKYRQEQAEVVSKSSNIVHQTWGPPFIS